jgi:hypothetical protein
MKTSNRVLFTEAVSLSANVDHVLANETLDGLESRDLYDLAEKLERASRLLLVLGDRKFQRNVNQHNLEEVPF